MKEEYELSLNGLFKVEYAFCINAYLKDHNIIKNTKQNIIFKQLMKKYNIEILFGDDENYFTKLDLWIYD